MIIVDNDGCWSIKFDRGTVSRIMIDYRFSFEISDESGISNVCFETKFAFSDKESNSVDIFPEVLTSLYPAFEVLNKSVDAVVIGRDGSIIINFNDSSFMISNKDDLFEAWQVGLSNGTLMVCSPGGNVSVFQNKPDSNNQIIQ